VLLGLFEMLLQPALQVAYLLHETLLELILADSLRLVSVLFGSFSAWWLAGALRGTHNLLLLFQVLQRLIYLLIASLRLIDLFDEVGQPLDVLTRRVLHADGASRARPRLMRC